MFGAIIVVLIVVVGVWWIFAGFADVPHEVPEPSTVTSKKEAPTDRCRNQDNHIEGHPKANQHHSSNDRDVLVNNRTNSAIERRDVNQQHGQMKGVLSGARKDPDVSRRKDGDQGIHANSYLEMEHRRYRKRRGKCADDVDGKTEPRDDNSKVADDKHDSLLDVGNMFDSHQDQNSSFYIPYFDTFGTEKHFKVKPTRAEMQNFEVSRQRRKKSKVQRHQIEAEDNSTPPVMSDIDSER